MRVLPGPSALTAFEAERVVQKLRTNFPAEAGKVVAVESSYLYLLLIRKEAEGTVDHRRLAELLGAGDELPSGQRVWIGPADWNAIALVQQGHRHSAQYRLQRD